MRTALSLLIFSFSLLSTSSLWAWDFSCSPEENTEVLAAIPPNVMLMLDRSGSMSGGDVADSCNVCEDGKGNRWKVNGANDCVSAGKSWKKKGTHALGQSRKSNGMSYEVELKVQPATEDMEMEIRFKADLSSACEKAFIYVDGVYFGDFHGNGTDCAFKYEYFTVPQYMANDGKILIQAYTTSDADCRNFTGKGVSLHCATNQMQVTVTHEVEERTYHGTKQWSDPCGSKDKWEQAETAINTVTNYSDYQDPQLASFGLGLFHDSSAYTVNDCKPSNHGAIENSLDDTGPSGGTPTASAIRASYQSDCLAGAQDETTIMRSTPKNSSNRGYDFAYTFTNLPRQGSDLRLKIGLNGDFGSSCELVEVYADNTFIGVVGDTSSSDCSSETQYLSVPAHLADDGIIEIKADTRADGERLGSCGSNDDGVEARCNNNEIAMTLGYTPADAPPQFGATVLINDGEPTTSISNGSGNARTDAIVEACAHREIARLFVVGLGSGTDEDYNNILAAAGGTGTCTVNGNEVDPCDSPSNWSDLRNDCTGSIQTGNDSELISAIASITESLGCVYPVNFEGSTVDSVPWDDTNEYEYLSVKMKNNDGTVDDVHYTASSLSSGRSWQFYDNSRTSVQFNDGLCDVVNVGGVKNVSTQLACMCEQQEGTECTVPNAGDLGVCPTGVWRCMEGTDFCEPSANCCTDGVACTVPGAEGVCAAGVWDCASDTCIPTNAPSEEVCDGLDNDCNGTVDDIQVEECVVPGKVGRCAIGTTSCVAGQPQCDGQLQPMPELCNGLDDDCDGMTDNITGSWEKPEFDHLQLTDGEKACLMADACICNSGSDNHAGSNFQEYVDEWDPTCHCGSALELPADEELMSVEQDQDPTAENDDSSAMGDEAMGCSSTGNTGSGMWLLIALFMLGRVSRRRRN